MSKVKIQGNASGSGVFTLTSPNSNTDRTITLPDGTGTLAFTTGDDDKLPLAGGTMTGTIAGFTSTGIDDNADATAITIDSNEKVGIGETAPLGYLHVKNGDSGQGSINSAGDSLVLESNGSTGITFLSGSSSNTSIVMGDSESNYQGVIIYDHSVNAFKFLTTGTERMRIASNGNVGINISSPLDLLHLNDPNDDCVLNLDTAIASKNSLIKFSDPDAQGRGFLQYAHSDDSFRTVVAGGEKTRIHSNGVLTVPAGVALGVAANLNTASNVLDDYEEGTWTPSINDGSPTYTTTYARTGVYTKIGNVVHIYMELYMGAISFGDATQTLVFSGLPFASRSTGDTFGMGMASSVTWSSIYTNGSTYNTGSMADASILHASPTILSNSSVFRISLSGKSNIGRSYLKNAAFHNGSGMAIGLTYHTA